MKKGLTLIEVILAIALISIISISFLPGITFGFKNLIESKKFTEDVFSSQMEIEKTMEVKRKETGGDTLDIFGVTVAGHNIDYGELHVFQPEKKEDYPVPKIIRNINSGLPSIVRLSAFNKSIETTPPPKSVNMFNGSNLDIDRNFLVDSKYYKIDNPTIFLVNVYRWYTSSMVGYSEDFEMDNYFIIKEWNAARTLISYEDSKTLKTIPNIQNDPDYNRLTFNEIKDGLDLNNTELINQYGNRYYYFSVTPFAISGKIGEEEYSNAIYVNAPRIEIDKAVFGPNENQISIYFKENIKGDIFKIDRMSLNEDFGSIKTVSRDTTNNKVMIVEFLTNINQDTDVDGNILQLGAVQSDPFGEISIWHNNIVEGEFTISPVPVTGVSIAGGDRSVAVGKTDILTVTVSPSDATNKNINWSSNSPGIVSVDSSGKVTGIAAGIAKIRATSVEDPLIYDEVTVKILTEEEQIYAELQVALAKITLIVNGPKTKSPTIDAPADSDGIKYAFTAKIPTDTTYITYSNKKTTVTRPSWPTNEVTVTITLTATKEGYSKPEVIANFDVKIPRSTSNAVTITKK